MHVSRQMARRAAQAGMSLVELLVGVVIGLFIVAAATFFIVNFNSENRRLVLETRLTQDMRAAMDIMTRELRRAGYWENAAAGANIYGAASAVVPYAGTGYASVLPASAPASSVTYSYSKDADNTASAATEQYSFAVSNGVLTTSIGNSGAQALTDAGTLFVEDFTVTPTTAAEDVVCPTTCTVNCPQTVIRGLAIRFSARAATDPTVRRTLNSSVRIRNDLQTGACPP